MSYPGDFYKWGGKYMYTWFFPQFINDKGGTTGFDAAEVKNPRAYVDTFSRAMWHDWEKLRGLGIVTGDRPAKFEDLWCLTEKYALAERDGRPLPDRVEIAYKDRMAGGICIANADVVRIMVALEKYNAAHLFDNRIRQDGYMPVNGGFVDLDGFQGCPMDYSEFASRNSTRGCTPTTLPNKSGRSSRPSRRSRSRFSRRKTPVRNSRIYDRMRTEFYYNVLWPEYCRTLKAAVDSVLGPGRFHYCYHGDGYWWRCCMPTPPTWSIGATGWTPTARSAESPRMSGEAGCTTRCPTSSSTAGAASRTTGTTATTSMTTSTRLGGSGASRWC